MPNLAYEIPVLNISTVVSSDQSANQFKVVKADGTIQTTSGGGGIGILQNKPKSGEVANIMILGISNAVTGADVAVNTLAGGDLVTNDTSGKVRKATAVGDKIIGVVAPGQTASAADKVISIIVMPSGFKAVTGSL